MEIKTLDEFNILQMVHSEVERLRSSNRIIEEVIITEEEYAKVRETLSMSEDAPPLATLPPSGIFFRIRGEDGELYNPAEKAQNRRVQVAQASDEIFKQ